MGRVDADAWRSPTATSIAVAMARSYETLTGEQLPGMTGDPLTDAEIAQALYETKVGLLCHDGGADPRFIYANRTAQRLWQMPWQRIVGMPSRLSAEPDQRAGRARMLREAATGGIFHGYRGIRVAADGTRFEIDDTTIWTVTDDAGDAVGQAALIGAWRPVAADRRI